MVGSKYGSLARWSSINWNPFLPLVFICLTITLWRVVPAVAKARGPTPTQLIQEGLPRGETIKSADKGQLTNAICRAVKRHRSATVRMTSAAATARPELAAEITSTVLRCLGKADCASVAKVVSAASKAKGTSPNAVADAAIVRAPDCADEIDRAARPVKKEPAQAVAKTEASPSASPKLTPDETFDPLETLRLVCDSGSQRAVRASELDEFLRTHPEAVLGTCPPNSSPWPGATIAPATLVPPPL